MYRDYDSSALSELQRLSEKLVETTAELKGAEDALDWMADSQGDKRRRYDYLLVVQALAVRLTKEVASELDRTDMLPASRGLPNRHKHNGNYLDLEMGLGPTEGYDVEATRNIGRSLVRDLHLELQRLGDKGLDRHTVISDDDVLREIPLWLLRDAVVAALDLEEFLDTYKPNLGG